MVNVKLIIAVLGVAAFLVAGGGKFIAPAVSKTKIALFETKTALTDTAAAIKAKTGVPENE